MERTTEYIGYREKYCDVVRVDIMWYDYRKDEDEKDLPKMGAFCKHCAKETAKPVYPVYMNCKPAYALRCEKCGNEYVMYKHTFIERYVGYDIRGGGHVNPTHGLMSYKDAMDRKAKQRFAERHASIKEEVEQKMCDTFGYTKEEYRNMKKKWEEDNKRIHKKIENERADFRAEMQKKKIQEESNKRKELIEKGILKFVKGVGLVNTQTGEVMKL